MFKKDGVYIFNSNGEEPPYVVAVFPDGFFVRYKVNKPFEGFAESDILTTLKHLPDHRRIECVELALLDEKTWKIRYGDYVTSKEYRHLEWRDFAFPFADVKLDEDAVPKTVHVKARLAPHRQLPRKQKGRLRLEMNDGVLTCSFTRHYGWECNQPLELLSIEKKAKARAIVDIEKLDAILKILRGEVWFGMWSDKSRLAIAQRTKEGTARCFII